MRYKQVTSDRTTYYIGSYEVEINHEDSQKNVTRAYIGDYAMMFRAFKKVELKYLHKDRLGSVDTITDGSTLATATNVSGMAQEQRSFNVFGRIVSNLWILGTDFTYEVEALADRTNSVKSVNTWNRFYQWGGGFSRQDE